MDGARERMVSAQLRAGGIRDERVLQAMAQVPREEFVPASLRELAYEDRALTIGRGQTISQPLVVAAMTQALELDSSHAVLEIGTGSGYQAAILALLAGRVVTVELDPALAERAAARLRRLGFSNVEVALGDGRLGWKPAAPYDGILVACAAPAAPAPLLDQLRVGGRIVMPFGLAEDDHQDLRVERRTEAGMEVRDLFPVRFVPLR